MNRRNGLLWVLITLLLAACAKPYTGAQGDAVIGGDGGDDAYYSDGYEEASTGDYYDDPNYGVNVQAGPSAPARDKIVYFAFDSVNIDSRSDAVIQAHANYLMQNPNVEVTLEGHTDERGTNEYNLRLSERRGYSVRDRFQGYGVAGTRLYVVGHGEEQPAAWGHDEASYAKNRRVVINYH